MREEQKRIRLEDEADRTRREKEQAERKRLREQELERRRQEAERKRLEDLERQRLENQRLRREAEIEAEDMFLAALSADDTTRWVFALQQQIARNFILPASAPENLECVVNIRQLAGGQVVNVVVGRCNGDASVRRAIVTAVFKASPLPSPDNPRIFDRDLQITFKPEQ